MRAWRRSLHQLAAAFGCAIVSDRRHYKLCHPSGWFVFCARSPSDHRAIHNLRAELRRASAAKRMMPKLDFKDVK